MADEKTLPHDEKRQKGKQDSVPEKLTFWLSLLIVLGLFGFLAFRTVTETRPGSPSARPGVSVQIDTNRARPINRMQWALPLIVRNSGNLALEEVMVRVTSTDKDGEKRDVDLSFAYLAEGAEETAFVIFPASPEVTKPEATVTAFKTQRNARGY